MNTSSKAVNAELSARLQSEAKPIKKRSQWELLAALFIVSAVVITVILLNANGLIREF